MATLNYRLLIIKPMVSSELPIMPLAAATVMGNVIAVNMAPAVRGFVALNIHLYLNVVTRQGLESNLVIASVPEISAANILH